MTLLRAGYLKASLRVAVVYAFALPLSLFALEKEKEKPQVRIEACVLEWQHSGELDVDFAVAYQRDQGGGSALQSAGLTTMSDQPLGSAARLFFDKLDTSAGSFDAVIEALEGAGTVRILSQPYNVVTSSEVSDAELNDEKKGANNTATLSNETEIPYESTKAAGRNLVSITEYQKAGVSLVVSVQKVIDDHLIVLTMDTNVSDITGFVNVGLNNLNQPTRVPTLDRRSISSRLIVVDGKMFIAGLMKTSQQVERRRGIPILGELPLLKYIFSSTSTETVEKELVFLVKAQILTPYKNYFDDVEEEAE
ncbi:MAG: type II and III secretion system protein [Lentisphaerae bacterium]|nr:type II and III secretion system protein [Lentisphaerota bacterium]